MEGNMKGNGLKIICMVKEFILGKMEESMKVNILMIKSMGMASILGLIVSNLLFDYLFFIER